MSIASQDVTYAFKNATEKKRPLDGSDTESDSEPEQSQEDADNVHTDDATMQMDLTEAFGGVLNKDSKKSPEKSPKKGISHSPTRKSPRLSSQNVHLAQKERETSPVAPMQPETAMQLPQFTLSPTASEKGNGSLSSDNDDENDEADTTMDFTVSMSQAGVPKLPQFETGRRRSSLDRRSSVIRQNSGSPEGPGSRPSASMDVDNSSSDDEEADQHMLMQPPPPPPDAPSQDNADSNNSNDDDDMDLTKAVTTHFDRNDTHTQKMGDESMTMEMTQAVGGLLGGEKSIREGSDAKNDSSSSNNSDGEQENENDRSAADMSLAGNTTHNNESMAMEMTNAVGGLLGGEKSDSDGGDVKNDNSSSDSEQENENDRSAADMSLASNTTHNNESMTMEMTQAVGGFTNVPSIPEEDSSSDSDSDDNVDATMTMEITKPIGKGILVNDETRRLRKSLGPRVSRVSFAPSVKASPVKTGAGPRPSLKSALKSSTSFAASPKKTSTSPDSNKRSSFSAPTQSSLIKKGAKGVRHSLGGALGGAGTGSPLRSALRNAAKSPNKKRASFAGELRQGDDGEKEQEQGQQNKIDKPMSPLVQRLQLASPLRPPPFKLNAASGAGENEDGNKDKKTHKPRRRSSLALSNQALEATPDTLAIEKENEEQSKNDREREYEREAEEERKKEEEERTRESEVGFRLLAKNSIDETRSNLALPLVLLPTAMQWRWTRWQSSNRAAHQRADALCTHSK